MTIAFLTSKKTEMLLENENLQENERVFEVGKGQDIHKGLSQKPKKGCRHCGIDSQSPDNKAVFFRRSRVKRGMTLF
jgi:hypothetical protein